MSGGRNIVVLADGTGNSAAKAFKTNVWRLYQALDLNGADQIAVFSDGVGTSTFKPFQVVGLALGFGVKRRVLALYKFLCLNYTEGDHIYAFGFSRGAFTIRVLVGLIHREGLVDFDSREELDRNALAAYRAYRQKAFPPGLPWIGGLRHLRDSLVRGWNWVTGSRSYSVVRPGADDPRAGGKVKIHFLGVWDTVAAYGLPIDELTRAVDRWVWPMSFKGKGLLSSVERARQAFSIDDERRTFFPIIWDEPAPILPGEDKAPIGAPPRLRQVWFAGAHANVGGGYADDRLAHVPLCWMIGEASESGLRFKPDIIADYWDEASESGRLYDSRSAFGIFYRYHPRSVAGLMSEGVTPLIDSSVIIRMAKGSDGYAPIALPEKIDILTPHGDVVPLDQLGGAAKPPRLPRRYDKLRLPPDRARDLKAMHYSLHDAARELVKARETGASERIQVMHDTVWWRRGLYYVTLGLVLLAALFPLFAGYLVIDRTANLEDGFKGLIVPLAGLLRGFLPGFAGPWLDAVVAHPGLATALASLIGLSLWLSGFLRTRIYDRARAVWNVAARNDGANLEASRKTAQRRIAYNGLLILGFALVVAVLAQFQKTALLLAILAAICAAAVAYLARLKDDHGGGRPFALSFARAVRTNAPAIRIYNALRLTWLPGLFLVVTAVLLVFVINKAAFEVANSMGQICPAAGAKKAETGDFEISSPCFDTGIDLDKGVTYKIEVLIPEDSPWNDGASCADVLGVKNLDRWESFKHYSATLMKRWWGEPYFQPIARIGQYGNDEYVLTSIRPLDPKKQCDNATLTAHISPRKSGRLYVYVNDAVIALPGIYDYFYRHNNAGQANVEVWEAEP